MTPRVIARSPILTAVIVTSLTAACDNPFVSYCGEETRSVSGSARFPESDPNAGYFQVDLLERRRDAPDEPQEQIGWVLISSELHGRITAAALIDRQSKSVRATLGTTPGGAPHALSGLGRYAGDATFRDLFQEMVNNRLAFRLETSIPGRAALEQPLQRAIYYDWSRARCD